MPYIGNIVQDFSVNTAMLNSDSVTSIKVLDGTIVNADINDSAAIAGTKISPDFGSQNIVTTGTLSSANFTITSANPSVTFTENDQDPDFGILCNGGQFRLQDITNTANLFTASSTTLRSVKHHDFDAGIDVTGAITATTNITATGNIVSSGNVDITGNLVVDTSTLKVDSTNDRVGIGTASPATLLHLDATDGAVLRMQRIGTNADNKLEFSHDGTDGTIESTNDLIFRTGGGIKATLLDTGNVGIGTTTPKRHLHIHEGTESTTVGLMLTNDATGTSNDSQGFQFKVGGDGTANIDQREDKDLDFFTNATFRMTITNGGDVGIAKSNPQAKLDVDGSAIFRSTLTFFDDTLAADSSSGTENRIKMGNNSDLQLFHDGRTGKNNSVIRSKQGDLQINSGNSAGNVEINLNENVANETKELSAKFIKNGGVELYENGSKMFETTGDGITVQKGVTVTGIEGGDAQIRLRADEGDDNNDTYRLLVADGGTGFQIQGFDGSFHTRLIIDSSGNVGIGTTSPTEKLHVYQDASDNVLALFEQNTLNQGNLISFKQTITGPETRTAFVGHGGDATGNLILQNSGGLALQTNGSNTALTIDTSQNVGIGTTTPRDKLEIKGANAGYSFRVDAEAQIVKLLSSDNTGSTQGGFRFCTDNGATEFERIRIDTAGRFLIAKGDSDTTTSQIQIGNATGGYTWDVGDVPQILIAGLNNESPTSGTLNIALRIADENDNTMFQVNNTGGGNNDLGRVGIGVSSPDAMLHVESNGVSIIRLTDTDTTAEDNSIIGLLEFETKDSNGPGVNASIGAYTKDTSNGNAYIAFKVGTAASTYAEELRIDNDGIKFNGDTAAANALDDYEEGTHSPTMTNLDVPSNVTVNHFNYTKIGRLVHFNAKFTVSGSINDVSGFGFSLPFTQAGSRENVFTAISDRSGSNTEPFAFVLNANQSNCYAKILDGFGNATYNSFSTNIVLVTGTYESE